MDPSMMAAAMEQMVRADVLTGRPTAPLLSGLCRALPRRASTRRRCSRGVRTLRRHGPRRQIRTESAASMTFALPCHCLSARGRKVMFDCGIHPGLHGASSLPYLTNEDLDEISVALITHFHLDHCAAVPYLIGHTTFKARCPPLTEIQRRSARAPTSPSALTRLALPLLSALLQGRIFMTHPTKAIFHTLVNDFATLAAASGAQQRPHRQRLHSCCTRPHLQPHHHHLHHRSHL